MDNAAAAEVDRNLLFGVIALQDDLIDRGQFTDVCAGWAVRMDASLADLLVARGWITEEERGEVERKLRRKLRKRGGDLRASLADAAGPEARDAIRAADRPILRASLATLPAPSATPLVETVVPEGRPSRGRYSLHAIHDEGGLGRVWLARDADLNRDVALKEIRPGREDDPEARRRFLIEAQITGQLEHPNIVPVYELTRRPEDDHPFYTMKFVRGRTLRAAIEEHHRRRGAGPADPLELQKLLAAFVSVCQAVGYAHARGVIHRDLKPENVMLGGFGEVIVLDWGLAKLVDRPDDDAPPVSLSGETAGGQTVGTVGTPLYMAPEQAEGRHDLIDARTDVYGLGAILFEILTGRPPVVGADSDQVQRRLREGGAPRARAVVPTVPRPLDAICARATARQRSARYARALDLADDVQCWIAGEPVRAYREPWTARARRRMARHRTLVAAAAALLLTAAVGLVVGVALLSEANARISEAAAKAEAINAFLVEELLAQAAPENNPRDSDITVLQLLDRAADRVGGRFAGRPVVEGAIRAAIGEAYRALGAHAKAQEQLRAALERNEAALGPEHPDTLDVVNNLASSLQEVGRLDEAEPLFRRALDGRRRALGPSHEATIASTNNLVLLLRDRGRLDEAEPLFRQALAEARRLLGDGNINTLVLFNNLALLLNDLGRHDEAESLFRQALELHRRHLPPEHPKTLTVLNNLATVLDDLGRDREAEALYREALDGRRRVLGPDHLETLITTYNLASCLDGRGAEAAAEAEAEALYRRALDGRRRMLPHGHPETRGTLRALVALLRRQGRWEEAEAPQRELLDLDRGALGPDHPESITALNDLAVLLVQRGRLDEAEPLYREAIDAHRRVHGPSDSRTLVVSRNLALLLQDRGRRRLASAPTERQPSLGLVGQLGALILNAASDWTEADRLFRMVLDEKRRALGDGHEETHAASRELVAFLQASGQPHAAERAVREWLERARATSPPGDPGLIEPLQQLAEILAASGRDDRALPLFEEAAALRRARPTGEAWLAADAQSRLGGCLARLDRLDDAEPLLLAAAADLADDPACPPETRLAAIDRAISLLERRNRPDEAAAWRARRLPIEAKEDRAP